MGPDVWFQWHQVLTHSLAGAMVLPLLLALIPVSFAPFGIRYLLAFTGWSLHIGLDIAARWSVPFLWPFSEKRWALMLIESDFSWRIDMLLVLGVALSLWNPAFSKGRWIAFITFLSVGLWLFSGLPT